MEVLTKRLTKFSCLSYYTQTYMSNLMHFQDELVYLYFF